MPAKERPLFQRPWVVSAIFLAIWPLLGLFEAGQTLFYYRLMDRYEPLDLVVLRGLAEWYIWALLAPFILDLGRWTPLGPARRPANLALQFGVLCLFALL